MDFVFLYEQFLVQWGAPWSAPLLCYHSSTAGEIISFQVMFSEAWCLELFVGLVELAAKVFLKWDSLQLMSAIGKLDYSIQAS